MTRWLSTRLVLDRVVAAIGAAALSPIVAVLAVLVKRDSHGRAFVRVERTGRDFEPFLMWKLRSMQSELPGDRADGPALTSTGDHRITSVGRWLRTWHLDEIPQLLNVVRGEMLLIGPRPEARDFVDPEDARWANLLRIPPGILGPTQLAVGDWERQWITASPDGSAYRDIVLPVKLAIDQWYVETVSPRRDMQVTAAIFRWLVGAGGRASMRERVIREVPAAKVLRDDPPPEFRARQENGA